MTTSVPGFTIHRIQAVEPEPSPLPEPRTVVADDAWARVRVYVLDRAMTAVWKAVGARAAVREHGAERVDLAKEPGPPDEDLVSERRGFWWEDLVIDRWARPMPVERGGGLAGRYGVDPEGQRFIVITDVLPAPDAPATPVRIDIRPEDWADIRAAIARLPGRRLLGWYHSHPGLGVRMSLVDRETQRRTFGVDWQVGLVVDPWSRDYRFHVGPRARPARWVALVADEGEAPGPA